MYRVARSDSQNAGISQVIEHNSYTAFRANLLVIVAVLFFALSVVAVAQVRYVDPRDDEKYYSIAAPNTFEWTPEQRVSAFRNAEKILPSRRIPASEQPHPIPYSPTDLGNFEFQNGGETLSLDDYFSRTNVAGLLVIKDGKILYERYGLGKDENSRWISFSVAKSAVSLLIGAAIHDGYINSIDDAATDYLARLKGSSYDQSTIRSLLQMASGVQWNEDYDDPDSDIQTAARFGWNTLKLYDYLSDLPRVSAPGEEFNYNTAETNLTGTLLRSAIGNNLSAYLAEKIWKPFGMEADAYWRLAEPGGGEVGGCCISATLRDYGRIGMFALSGGLLPDGTRVLPENWMNESTAPSNGNDEYGYFWWLTRPGEYTAWGIYGQIIHINPDADIVIAMHSAWDIAEDEKHVAVTTAFITSLTDAVAELRSE